MPRGRIPKQPVDLAYLKEVERALRKRMTVLKGVQSAMQEQGIESTKVDGTTGLDEAYGKLDTFLRSCKRELGEL